MFCTDCEEDILDIEHYKTQLHAINARRKISGLFPIHTCDLEFSSDNSELSCGNISVDMYSEESIDLRGILRLYTGPGPSKPKCVYCEEDESIEHYILDHGMSVDQVSYLYSKVCYICKEGFISKKDLIRHLEEDKHRNILTDGISIFLENGKILHPEKIKFTTQTLGFKNKTMK